jgi:hypothetical protein
VKDSIDGDVSVIDTCDWEGTCVFDNCVEELSSEEVEEVVFVSGSCWD